MIRSSERVNRSFRCNLARRAMALDLANQERTVQGVMNMVRHEIDRLQETGHLFQQWSTEFPSILYQSKCLRAITTLVLLVSNSQWMVYSLQPEIHALARNPGSLSFLIQMEQHLLYIQHIHYQWSRQRLHTSFKHFMTAIALEAKHCVRAQQRNVRMILLNFRNILMAQTLYTKPFSHDLQPFGEVNVFA